MDHEPQPSPDKPPHSFVALEAMIRITQDQGRWVVYLNVPFWDPRVDQHPVSNRWKRINDYATKQEAEVAAHWYQRSANRHTKPPTGF